MKFKLFLALWGFDALICVIIVFFFFIGIADGSVSSFNAELWMLILFTLAVILAGSFWLKKAGHIVLAIFLLLILAVPGFFSGIFIFLSVVTEMSWN